MDDQMIIEKLKRGGTHNIKISSELREKYNITDKLIDELNNNNYRISLLFESILNADKCMNDEERAEFTLLNHLMPLFINYCDRVIDEGRDEKAIKELVLAIKYGKKHTSPIVRVMSKICMENIELRNELLNTYNSNKQKKNTKNSFKYIKGCFKEGLHCGLAQVSIFPMDYNSNSYTNLIGFVRVGILDSVIDDLKDFKEDYQNGEIKLKPNLFNRALFKVSVNLFEQNVKNKYPREYEIFKVWEEYKYKHEYKFEF